MGESTTPVPPPELLLDKLFDVIRQSGLAQSCHDRRRFRNELVGVAVVDADRVELKQDLDQRVVQRPILSSKVFARRATLLGFICVGGFVHARNGPYRSLAIADTLSWRAWMTIYRDPQLASSTRLRSKSKRARPNICLLATLSLFTLPSTGPEFQRSVSPAWTASQSCWRLRLKPRNSGGPV